MLTDCTDAVGETPLLSVVDVDYTSASACDCLRHYVHREETHRAHLDLHVGLGFLDQWGHFLWQDTCGVFELEVGPM
jgi:hypothetical protein